MAGTSVNMLHQHPGLHHTETSVIVRAIKVSWYNRKHVNAGVRASLVALLCAFFFNWNGIVPV
jgi:hypothetical protein